LYFVGCLTGSLLRDKRKLSVSLCVFVRLSGLTVMNNGLTIVVVAL
jgi:hypothetical protein